MKLTKTEENAMAKINGFVKTLCQEKISMEIGEPTLCGQTETPKGVSYRFKSDVLNMPKGLGWFLRLVNISYNISSTGNGFILYTLEMSFQHVEGGNNGWKLPVGDFEFSQNGELLTKGEYRPFSDVKIEETIILYGTKYKKIAEDDYPNLKVIEGPRKGENFYISALDLVLVP